MWGRWKASIERLCLSPYVKKPLNSKVIKSFVPELRSRKCFSCFGIYVMNILCMFYISISWVCYNYWYLMAYKIHGCRRRTPISAEQIKKKQSTNIKCDEIDIMNIINDKTFNLHKSLLNNDSRYLKVTLKSKLIRVIQ